MSRETVKTRITTMARSIGQMARQSECWGIALFVGVIAAIFGGSTAVMLAVGGLAALGLLAAGSSSVRRSIADMERARQKRERRAQRASTIAKWGLPLNPHHQLTTLVDAIAKASPADDTLFELEDLLDYHVSLMVVRHRSMCALASEDAAGKRKSADGRMHCSTTPALATVHALRRDTCFALHQQVIACDQELAAIEGFVCVLDLRATQHETTGAVEHKQLDERLLCLAIQDDVHRIAQGNHD